MRKSRDRNGFKVFVVDDDAAMRDSLEAMLRARGMCAEAFATFPDFLAGYNRADRGCLVIDLNLSGSSGIECLQRLAEEGIRLPAILMTGRSDRRFAAESLAAGAYATLLKPFRPAALVDLISRALEEGALP